MDPDVKICVSKNPSLADERVDITISGLQKAQKITLHGITTQENGASFQSFAHYIAGYEGRVYLDQDTSFGGTYEGIDPMGPFWSLTPSPWNKRKHQRFLVKEPSKPFVLDLHVYDSFLSLEEIRSSRENYLCSLNVVRTYSAPGVSFEEVRVGRVRGYLFFPPGQGPFPGVISMSGGYPGAMKYKGALLASHGYATLALKYFGEDDLPNYFLDLDLTYFEEAAAFLKNHSRVNGKNGVGIVANCLGASIGLCMAACAYPDLINCVVSVNGWFYTYWGKMSYKEKIWPKADAYIAEYEAKDEESLRMTVRLPYSPDPNDKRWEQHLYQFYKRHDISFLLIFGEDDTSVEPKGSIAFCKMLLEQEGHKNHEILIYPRAGHLIEHAYNPLGKVAFTLNTSLYYGGEQPEHERAQEDSWLKILAFLQRNLASKERSKL